VLVLEQRDCVALDIWLAAFVSTVPGPRVRKGQGNAATHDTTGDDDDDSQAFAFCTNITAAVAVAGVLSTPLSRISD
jgi:hypothetical protein